MKVDIVRGFRLAHFLSLFIIERFVIAVVVVVGLDVTLQALGGPVHEATDVTAVLFFQVVDLFVFVVKLLEFEGPGTLVTGVREFAHPDVFSFSGLKIK